MKKLSLTGHEDWVRDVHFTNEGTYASSKSDILTVKGLGPEKIFKEAFPDGEWV